MASALKYGASCGIANHTAAPIARLAAVMIGKFLSKRRSPTKSPRCRSVAQSNSALTQPAMDVAKAMPTCGGRPISLNVTLEDIASNPRREDCFGVIKTWEDARIGNHLTEADREMLKNVAPEQARYVPCYQQREIWDNRCAGRNLTDAQRAILADRREHHLLVNERGQYEIVAIEEIPNLAGGALKAYTFQRALRPDETCVLIWAINDEVTLQLTVAGDRLTVMRPFGKRVPFQSELKSAAVRIGDRKYLVLARTQPDQAGQILRGAKTVR